MNVESVQQSHQRTHFLKQFEFVKLISQAAPCCVLDGATEFCTLRLCFDGYPLGSSKTTETVTSCQFFMLLTCFIVLKTHICFLRLVVIGIFHVSWTIVLVGKHRLNEMPLGKLPLPMAFNM